MAEKSASDLFITAGAPVCIKIRGTVMPVNNQVLDAAGVQRIAREVMSDQQAEKFERTLELNFSTGISGVGIFRVNVFRQRGAMGMVIRHVRNQIPTLEQLRVPERLKDLVLDKRGLVLVVGATGSGKSSTLAAMIDHRNSTQPGHILTIEDPIEFNFQHRRSLVNQREIGMDTRSYADALASAMREAPDVLMIGEVRDRETMQQAVTYAQTGHLCLTTLHANNSYHALNRILTFFAQDARASLLMDLSMTLRAVVSQRLLRGVDGSLVPAVEVMLNTAAIAELIRRGAFDQIREMMEQSLSPGSQTFEQSLFDLINRGLVTPQEALANADSATNLSWLIDNGQQAGGVRAPSPTRPGEAVSSVAPVPRGPGDREPGPRTPGSDLGSFTFNFDVV
jgi:twitching motility protein PilU